MTDINNDLLHTSLVMNGRRFPNYNRVYFNSNENVKDVLSVLDIKDKKVLSVLGSGDQAFHLLNNDALKVDLFDINKLTIYYYYLRRWTMKYLNHFYPNDDFNIKFIKELLSLVEIKDKNEKIAFDYWCKYIELFDDKRSNKLFYRGIFDNVNDLDDFSKVKKRLDEDICFYNVDISDNISTIKDKYDVLYLSNISDYVLPNYLSFENYKVNLEELLKPGGYIVSINGRKNGVSKMEKDVFSDDFYIEELPEEEKYGFYLSSGNVYIKK